MDDKVLAPMRALRMEALQQRSFTLVTLYNRLAEALGVETITIEQIEMASKDLYPG